MSCFVIAECGVNWRDLVDADQMIKAAAEAGADAAKFQAYTQMTGATNPLFERLNAIRLDESTIRYLYWRCRQHGIEFMCTPMYPDAVTLLDPYVKRWKIRYSDRLNTTITTPCLNTGKDLLISTDLALAYQPIRPEQRIDYLWCVPEYPPGPIDTITCKGLTGCSCHFPLTHIEFTGNPPEYLEVHVRLDHYEPPHHCPIDTAVSITMSELTDLCRRVKK